MKAQKRAKKSNNNIERFTISLTWILLARSYY